MCKPGPTRGVAPPDNIGDSDRWEDPRDTYGGQTEDTEAGIKQAKESTSEFGDYTDDDPWYEGPPATLLWPPYIEQAEKETP